ncbi:cell division topological specificity factor MinE [bacterium]|nr:cell division topological specificity factor MinE [bacterium]
MKEIFTDLYNKVLEFFTKTEEKESSKNVARNRLKLVLMQDRTNLNPQLLERLRGEMIELLSKYVIIDKELLELNFTPEDEQLALMLSIPVIRAKNEEEIEETIKAEDEQKAKIAKLLEESQNEDESASEEENDKDNEVAGTDEKVEDSDVKNIEESEELEKVEESENDCLEETDNVESSDGSVSERKFHSGGQLKKSKKHKSKNKETRKEENNSDVQDDNKPSYIVDNGNVSSYIVTNEGNMSEERK